MKIYLIDGRDKIGKTEFTSLLAENLSKNKKTIIIGTNRSEDNNIEDYYKQDGMITYDICDYFLDYIDLNTIINTANDKLDFIISPFIKEKYEVKKEDIQKLLGKLEYDYVIFDGLNPELLDDKVTIKIVGQDEIENNIEADFFFINNTDSDFDQRLYKQEITNKEAKYLGFVNKNGSYNNILDNLLNDRQEIISNIGFFEKLKMKFKS
ncbi:MAG: hypothetical protein ACTIH2_00780 [Anaerococcus sp.]